MADQPRPAPDPTAPPQASAVLPGLLLTALGIGLASLIRSRDCQQELTRQQPAGSTAPPAPPAEAQLRKS
jgi:hypothetical protein